VTLACAAAYGAGVAETKSVGTTMAHASKRKVTRALSLGERVNRQERIIDRCHRAIRFFERHPRLLRSGRQREAHRTTLRRAQRRLLRAERTVERLHRILARREARRLAKAPPRTAICHVFGRSYCRQALAVSWCESRHSTTAQNGQYLGLFQMGSYERGMFGHGLSAHAQAVAAHKYFVLSGRDWSPWSCKPWYAS
jgi:hypothetical protein